MKKLTVAILLVTSASWAVAQTSVPTQPGYSQQPGYSTPGYPQQQPGYGQGQRGYPREGYPQQNYQQAPQGYQPQRYAPPPETPDQLLRRGLDRLTGFLIGSQNPSTEAVRVFVDHEIAPYFDFDYMSRWVAGPFYRRLSDHHRAALGQRLQSMFLGALIRNLGTFSQPIPRVDVFPTRPSRRPNEATVDARIVTNGGMLVNMEFRFYWGHQGWRVYDVMANGASAVGFYRTYFTTLLRREGPDALLRR